MAFFNRKLYRQKPKQWGPVSQVQASIFKNAERAGIDPTSIKAFFPMWESAGLRIFDYVGYNHGSSQNGAGWAGPKTVFDGNNDFWNIGSIQFNNELSIFAIAKSIASGRRGIVSGYTTNAGFIFRQEATSSYLYFRIKSGSECTTSTNFADSAEHAVIATHKHGAQSIYVDGVLEATDNGPGPIDYFGAPIYIGQDYTAARNWSGDMSTVGLFQYCLTAYQADYLSDNPYFLLYRVPPVFYSSAAGGTERNLIADIVGSSTTSAISATVLRSILADINGSSTTSDITASLAAVIDLVASIVGSSTTSDISINISRSLIADLIGSSTTPGIQSTIERILIAQIVGSSATSDVQVSIVREMIAAVVGESVTSDIAATIQGIIDLIAQVAGSSVTSDIAAITARELSANIQAASVTSDIVAATVRTLSAAIAGSSVTSDITANLENVINFVAAVQGVSVTSDIAATIARSLTASISGLSVTSDIAATAVREMLAAIEGTSTTPDDLVLIMAGLGVIIDPSISSVTTVRTIRATNTWRSIN